jgi:hypothetical protein
MTEADQTAIKAERCMSYLVEIKDVMDKHNGVEHNVKREK